MTARITAIADGITIQAKLNGVWRDLEESDQITSGEEILAQADGAQYELTAYKLQRLQAGSYVDALTIVLNTPDGSSHYRQDRVLITGDVSTNAVSVLTIDKGQRMLADLLTHLKAQEWNRFSFPVGTGATPAKYRGTSDDLDHATRLEVGGMAQDFQGLIVCDREQFGAIVPKSGQKLQWSNGRVYRIETVREDEISFALEVISINK